MVLAATKNEHETGSTETTPFDCSCQDTWVVHNTFLEISEREEPGTSKRSHSDPSARGVRSKGFHGKDPIEVVKEMEVARQEVLDQRTRIIENDVKTGALLDELAFVVKTPNDAAVSPSMVQQMEEDLIDLHDKVAAVDISVNTAQKECQLLLMGASSKQEELYEELAAKNSEHDQLEEECDRLREEVEKSQQERQVAKKIVPTRGKQYAGESASPMLLLEAQRRRSKTLLSLSESRSAKMEAARKQQEAKDLENAARAEAKEKEVLLQQRRESLLARETALMKELEALNDQFEQAQKSKEATERHRVLWGELLQKGRARYDMIQSKVECAETKASLACGEVQIATQKIEDLKEKLNAFESDLATALENQSFAVKLHSFAYVLLLLAFLFAYCMV